MTIDEAITNLKCLEEDVEGGLEDYEIDAIKLGIEALERVVLNRRIGNTPECILLTGETKD